MFRPALVSLFIFFSLWPLTATAEITISGRILEPAGDPLPGARVRLEPLPGSFDRALLRLEGEAGPEPVAIVETDESGAFELRAPAAGMWKVVVEAGGRLTTECRLVPLVEPLVLPDLPLPVAERLEIHLVTKAGEPRSGWVGAQSLDGRGPWRPRLRLAVAGPDGQVLLPIGPDEKIRLEALAEGHPLVEREVVGERTLRLEVPDGVPRKVRFLGRGRKPAAGAIAVQGSALLPLGRSGEDGRLRVVVRREDPRPLKALTRDLWHGAFALGSADEPREKRLRLEPPERLRGRVLDLETKEPVAGAWVWSVRGEFAHTDERGQYTLERGVHRTSTVRAVAPGYRRGDSRIGESSEPPAIGIAPTASIAGRVVDGDGQPLEGVVYGPRLRSYVGSAHLPSSWRWLTNPHTARTPADGSFLVVGLPTRADLELFFEAPGFAPQTLEILPFEAFERRSGIEVEMLAGLRAIGQVVDSGEAPVAGAEIRLEAARSGNVRIESWRNRFDRREDAETPLLSDDEGRFEVGDLAPGRYDLTVSAPGFAPARIPGLPVGDGPAVVDLGTVVLAPGATLHGRVVDEENQPVEGAQVAAHLGNRGLHAHLQQSSEPVRTGPDGRFEILDLLPEQPMSLAASREGYGSAILSVVVAPSEEPLEIVLRNAGTLEGRVVDPEGRSIEGAVLHVYPNYRQTSSLVRATLPDRNLSARTSADGSFQISGVPPEKLSLGVNAEGFQHHFRSDLEVLSGETVAIEIVLEPGAVVEGTVATVDGEPVARARIHIDRVAKADGSRHGSMARGHSDLEGRFRLTGVPIGKVSVDLHAPNGQVVQKSLEIEPGTNFLELELESGFEVSGQVVDATGSPVANAAIAVELVKASGEHSFVAGPPEGVVSGADGAFVLPDIGAGDYRITATREGFARAQTETLQVRTHTSGILLELLQGAVLRGQVLGLELEELGSLVLYAYGGSGEMQRAELDYSGAYSFQNLAPGNWQVHAMVARPPRSVTVQVEIPPGALEVEKDLELAAGSTLSGEVSTGGRPMPGAQITASGAGHSAMGITDTAGRFRIESLPDGQYSVTVSTLGERRYSEVVEVEGDRDIRIEIPTGALAGVVRDAGNGDPLSGASISLQLLDGLGSGDSTRPPSYIQPRSTDFQGRFELDTLRPGRYRLVASKADFGSEERIVDVREGGLGPELEIRLSPTEGIELEVALASGEPLVQVHVALVSPGSGQILTHAPYPVLDGRVRMNTVPPGSWDLAIQGGESASTRFRVTSPGDQGRLLLPLGGSLQVWVPALETEGIAAVSLRGPDGRLFVSALGRSPLRPGQWPLHAGRATIPQLLPGIWTLEVSHRGQTWSGSAEVVAGRTVDVTLP